LTFFPIEVSLGSAYRDNCEQTNKDGFLMAATFITVQDITKPLSPIA
jgi:hypothetical protein